ncbi:spore germination protein GerPE [Paenibacillus endoradicis]|uniref:spore germination protein GerPE n=1 Tax=Paenibacillus endoradicis TaxID=2972487 RepID=UPI0021599616|nr:spore germination protein GerPE [Paenibacillus endoradicis]MCR8659254.1 spore germination protein GerPE [Paenibacillus endoradicis]
MSHNTLSSVTKLNIISNSSSSIIQVGDRDNTSLFSRSIVVLQDITRNTGDEPNFNQYHIFCRPSLNLQCFLSPSRIIERESNIEQPLDLNAIPDITIGRLKVISNSDASNIQIGNGKRLNSEYRSKSFEQYFTSKPHKKEYPFSP